MKVLVSTSELKGRTLRSVPSQMNLHGYLATYSYVPEGELVMPLVSWEVFCCGHDHVALGGVHTHKATTNFKVVEKSSFTLKKLENEFLASLRSQGWAGRNNGFFKQPGPMCQKLAKSFAGAISRAAAKFPIGDVLSKQGCKFWSRKDPRRSAKIIVRLG